MDVMPAIPDMLSLNIASRAACVMLAPIDALSPCRAHGSHNTSKSRAHLVEHVFFAAVCQDCLRCDRQGLEITQCVLPHVVSTSNRYTIRNFANSAGENPNIPGVVVVKAYLQ